MSPGIARGDDLFQLEATVWLWTRPIGVPIYDFAFPPFFPCQRPYARPTEIEVVARVGALTSYETTYADLLLDGVRLVHSPEQHLRATLLPHWYPLLEGMTPKSLWFAGAPDPQVIERELGWPIFMKGARQTNRHKRKLSIISGPAELRRALEQYAQDPVLGWQEIVCRGFAPLRPVEDPDPDRIPSSYEFRTFWWRGELAGCGRYWWEGAKYELAPHERGEALERRSGYREARRRAQGSTGRWAP